MKTRRGALGGQLCKGEYQHEIQQTRRGIATITSWSSSPAAATTTGSAATAAPTAPPQAATAAPAAPGTAPPRPAATVCSTARSSASSSTPARRSHLLAGPQQRERSGRDPDLPRLLAAARGLHRRQDRLRGHRPVRDRGQGACRGRQPARRDRLPAARSACSTLAKSQPHPVPRRRRRSTSTTTTSPVGQSSPRSTARSTACLAAPTSSRSCGTARRHSPTRATRSRRRSRS